MRDELVEQSLGQLRRPLYVCSSMFLYDCYGDLVDGAEERMHYVTGITAGNVHVLTRIVKFGLQSNSVVHADGDPETSLKALLELDRFGHSLLGLFHRHPGAGAGATFPSSHRDLVTQQNYEDGGHKTIGAIFTADGFVRFFGSKKEFETAVYGKGVTKVGDNLWHLDFIGELHDDTDPSEGAWGRSCSRQAEPAAGLQSGEACSGESDPDRSWWPWERSRRGPGEKGHRSS